MIGLNLFIPRVSKIVAYFSYRFGLPSYKNAITQRIKTSLLIREYSPFKEDEPPKRGSEKETGELKDTDKVRSVQEEGYFYHKDKEKLKKFRKTLKEKGSDDDKKGDNK